ncbi:MAG TPA: SGNH/GDSL hydrolase family protein [Tepidisphaeraceae bacterium]|nr:SGNH/GDSL hydrolase family protein [Tepidisphaeraceae bacterium]
MSESQLDRRSFIATSVAVGSATLLSTIPGFAQTTSAARTETRPSTVSEESQSRLPDNIQWYDVREWGVEGKGFADTKDFYDRLPTRAKGVVRNAIWDLSQFSTGMSAHFEADTAAIFVRYEVTDKKTAIARHSGSGVDLYARYEDKWRYLATHLPIAPVVAHELQNHIYPGRRTYHLNLPYFNGVRSMEIGIPKGDYFKPIAPRREKAILFYGTSITQGGHASRPGMSFVTILGRKLDLPILNFGFSGNGKMEPAVAQFLAELDPAIFVIDCVGNSSLRDITDHTVPVVKTLRAARASTPILLLDRPLFPNRNLCGHPYNDVPAKNAALRKCYEDLLQAGTSKLFYRIGEGLIGSDGDATVDGAHPSDLGMMRYADGLEPTLREILTPA